jgi:acetylornithine deacetylase
MLNTKVRQLINTLVSFDTTSRNSNLALITFIQDYLMDLGVASTLLHNDDKSKANLFATLGPVDRPGIMLSGHTDVVPVDGQKWTTDPWTVVQKDSRLYGRGTCDMKAFIAVCLAYAPQYLQRNPTAPLHFAFSYDEEIGCIGVHSLLEMLNHMPVKPAMCIVGEPTGMNVSLGHKGKYNYRAIIRGFETHSSLAPHGVNAIEYAAQLIVYLRSLSDRYGSEGPFDEAFDVTHTTVHTGVINGGTVLNIVPRECSFEFEFRNLAEHDPAQIIADIQHYVSTEITPRMEAVRTIDGAAIPGEVGVEIRQENYAPGLSTDAEADVVSFVKSLAGRNDHIKVAFATEAGLFDSHVGIPTVIRGPGHIEQAHKPDEYLDLDQLDQCCQFMSRLIERTTER